MEALVKTRSEAAWVSTVTVWAQETVPGSFAAKVEFSKAARVYAAETGTPLLNVTVQMLKKTNLGVQGYASKYEATPAAFPKPGGDGSMAKPGRKAPETQPLPPPQQPESAPAKKRDFAEFWDEGKPVPNSNPGEPSAKGEESKPRKKGKADNSIGKKEKEVKELLAQEQASDNAMTLIAAGMARDPLWWAWAKDSVLGYKRHREDVVQLYADNTFFTSFKVAALSAKETMKLRKDFKDDYLAKLCEFCTLLGPKILLMAEASFQIQQMASAKRSAAETLQKQRSGPLGKPKAKSKAGKKGKNQASAQSAQA